MHTWVPDIRHSGGGEGVAAPEMLMSGTQLRSRVPDRRQRGDCEEIRAGGYDFRNRDFAVTNFPKPCFGVTDFP